MQLEVASAVEQPTCGIDESVLVRSVENDSLNAEMEVVVVVVVDF